MKTIKLRYRTSVKSNSARNEVELSKRLNNLEQHYTRPPQDPGVET